VKTSNPGNKSFVIWFLYQILLRWYNIKEDKMSRTGSMKGKFGKWIQHFGQKI
jgi:hypothetical protein